MKLIAFFFTILISSNVFATEWKTETVDDGAIVVNSKVYSEKNSEGKKQQILDYNAEIITDASFENVVATLLNIAKHKEFLDGAKESKMVDGENEATYVYYYLNAPWPMADADCVTAMQYTQTDTAFEMTLTSKPDVIAKTKVKRMGMYGATYIVEKVEEGTKVKIDYKLSPAAKAPAFLVKTWFPKGPAEILKRLVNLAK